MSRVDWIACSQVLLEKKPDATLMSGCIQAQSNLAAAESTAIATDHLGLYTFGTGFLAIVAAIVGAWAVTKSARTSLRIARETQIRNGLTVCITYISEILAIRDYLKDNDVESTLEKKAEARTRLSFHPGSRWLLTYQRDPSSIGIFPTDLARRLTYFCSRMLNEVERLTWMHDLETGTVTDALQTQMKDSAVTLRQLRVEADQLIKDLEKQITMTVSAMTHYHSDRDAKGVMAAVVKGFKTKKWTVS